MGTFEICTYWVSRGIDPMVKHLRGFYLKLSMFSTKEFHVNTTIVNYCFIIFLVMQALILWLTAATKERDCSLENSPS